MARGVGKSDGADSARLIDAVVSRLRSSGSSLLTGEVVGAKDFISTQCLALDLALNMPGIPVGRLTVVRGWESSGKTSLVTHLLAETVRRGGIAALLDGEFAFDEARAARLGLAREDLILAQPETVEETIKLLEDTIKAVREETPDALATVVWDSVGGTPTKDEIEGEFGDSKPIGQHAKLISAALRRIMGTVSKQNIALVIVNQNRESLNMGPFASSDSSTMIARRPLQFHASVIIDMRKAEELRTAKDGPAYGILAKAKIAKNKCSDPFGKAEMRVLFDTGFDNNYSHFQAALKLGMVVKKSSWYRMADADEAFHVSDFGDVLQANPGLQEKIAATAREEFWPDTVKQRFL